MKQLYIDAVKEATQYRKNPERAIELLGLMDNETPNEYERLAVRVANYRDVLESVNRRGKIAQLIEDRKFVTEDGREVVALGIWSRDCDLCESTSTSLIEPDVNAFYAYEREEYEWAEGPKSIWIITPKQYREFEPSFRDRAAEMMNY